VAETPERDRVELRWPGKYDADGQRVALVDHGVELIERERFEEPAENQLIRADHLHALEA